jgi:hypothetical protein
VFKRTFYWSLSWARWVQSIPPHTISLRPILILYCHLGLGLPSVYLLFHIVITTQLFCLSKRLADRIYCHVSGVPWQEIDGFRNRWNCLLDNSFTITTTITPKWRLPDDATWLARRLWSTSDLVFSLVFSDLAFSDLLWSLLWSGLPSGLLWSDWFSVLLWSKLRSGLLWSDFCSGLLSGFL